MFQAVQRRPNDPYIYMYVDIMREWYCYNPNEVPLGSGAMGTVFRGYRCKNGTVIAVKRVNDTFANNKMIRERAKQEASLAFRHPNLVEMIGYCEEAPDHGPIFILSNYVNGEDIDKFVQHLDPGNRTEKICYLFCQALDALSYIHRRGVIHRDIKPSNIMVENGSNVRLMDLGIARMNGGNKFSHLGFIGTPEYSAPEQIAREERGGNIQINATTDIYGLGITFYEMLTGVNPMAKQSEADTLSAQMHDPLPPDERIPKRLYAVLRKATEKSQMRRFQSAEEFKLAIEEAMRPEPPQKGNSVLIGILVGLTFLAIVVILVIILFYN